MLPSHQHFATNNHRNIFAKQMNNPSVVTLGTIAIDTVKTRYGEMTSIGGSGTYAALASATISHTGIVSAVGQDFATESAQIFANHGINISGISVIDGPTFRWTANYHDDMAHRDTLYTDVGVFKTFEPKVNFDYKSAHCIVLGAISPDIQMSFISQFDCPKLIIGDTIDYYLSQNPEKVLAVFRLCHAIVVNEEEALKLSRQSKISEAAQRLLSLGPQAVIIKQAENGATLYKDTSKWYIPAYQGSISRDPTGAGDAFLGAFAAYLSNKLPIVDTDFLEAIVFANCIASFSIETFGINGLINVDICKLTERCQSICSDASLPMPNLNGYFPNIKKSYDLNLSTQGKTIKKDDYFPYHYNISHDDVMRDIDTILWSMRLHGIRRYFHQRFFEVESREADYASLIEPYPRLESVSEHSWHVADMVLILGPHFPGLDLFRSLSLAILHDKLEISTGDIAPIGRDGTGDKTHAFNVDLRIEKEVDEAEAAEEYLSRLSQGAMIFQRQLFSELISMETKEALFVKAVDKLQALAFVYMKKNGKFPDKHLRFTLQYTKKCVELFPPLSVHYEELKKRLMISVANQRKIKLKDITMKFQTQQLELF